MESLVQQAREAHRVSQEHSRLSAHHRERRDHAVRRLYATGAWSYAKLAHQIGCSPELIAKIVGGRPERGKPFVCPCGEGCEKLCDQCRYRMGKRC